MCYGLDVRVRYTKSSTVKSPNALRLSRHCNANTNVYLEKKNHFSIKRAYSYRKYLFSPVAVLDPRCAVCSNRLFIGLFCVSGTYQTILCDIKIEFTRESPTSIVLYNSVSSVSLYCFIENYILQLYIC